MDYPTLLSSSPTISPSATTPSLQPTAFTFPTPPPSTSSSPSYHTLPPANPDMISPPAPAAPSFAPPSGLDMSSHPLLPPVDEPLTAGTNSPSDQSSAVFVYPPAASQAPPPPQPCSAPPYGAAAPFAFPSVPPHMQNLSFPTVPPGQHLPNLSHQGQAPALAAPFPPSSFTHPPSSLPPPPFQPSSCLAVSSAGPPLPPAAHPQSLSTAVSSSYPSMEMGPIPPFNPPGPYRSEMVLHHPSLPSSAPPALYPAFSSYPLRLCQDPHSSLSIPLRHLYRHQHGHAHPQGSYLDMSTRAVY